MKVTATIVCAYALLILLGGLIGYYKAGSIASLISGITFGIALTLCSIAIAKGKILAQYAALILTFFLDLRNPTPIPQITNNGYTTTQQVQDVIAGLERHRTQYIAWNVRYLDQIPDWENPSDAHLQPLRDYIRAHYDLVKVFDDPGDEIWEKRPD